MAHGTFKHNELMMGCHGINTGILEMKCISVYAIDVNIYIYIYIYIYIHTITESNIYDM